MSGWLKSDPPGGHCFRGRLGLFVLRRRQSDERRCRRRVARAELEPRAKIRLQARPRAIIQQKAQARAEQRQRSAGHVELVRHVEQSSVGQLDTIHLAIRLVVGNAGRPAVLLVSGVRPT